MKMILRKTTSGEMGLSLLGEAQCHSTGRTTIWAIDDEAGLNYHDTKTKTAAAAIIEWANAEWDGIGDLEISWIGEGREWRKARQIDCDGRSTAGGDYLGG